MIRHLKNLKKLIPFLIIGLFVGHSVLWYGLSFYVDYRLKKLFETLEVHQIQVSYTKMHTGGYPGNFEQHFHDVRLTIKDRGTCVIPLLSVQGDLFFPITQKIKVHFEGVTTLKALSTPYTVTCANMRGRVCLSPLALEIYTKSLTFLTEEIPFGEGKKTTFSLSQTQDPSKMQIRFNSDMKLWFANFLSPTLPFQLTLNCLLNPPHFLWRSHSSTADSEATLEIEKLKFQMIGATLVGRGLLTKTRRSSWEGDLKVRLQGPTQFTSLLKNFTTFPSDPLVDFMTTLTRILKTDVEGGVTLSCQLQNGHLFFKELPFFKIPLFEAIPLSSP